MTLDERKKKILEAIIRDYVESAEPVGSRSMVRKHDLKVSAATVRNEMADLEDMGYLEQPHTSAGRIPSEMGFRYYVDSMMQVESLEDEELELLYRILNENIADWGDVVRKVGNFLSQITNYASFVIVPAIKLSEFQRMQILPVKRGKALLIVFTNSGVMMHRKIDIPTSVTPDELQLIGSAISRVLAGKKLEEICRDNLQAVRDELRQRRKVIDRALEALDTMMQESNHETVVINGALNILNEPEFKDMDKLRRILSILEEDLLLKNIIPETSGDDVNITIGKENKAEDIQEMSIVLGGYANFGDIGRIGVIGPVRMEYWKAAGSVEALRKILEDIFNKGL